jgi:hypothetical protein
MFGTGEGVWTEAPAKAFQCVSGREKGTNFMTIALIRDAEVEIAAPAESVVYDGAADTERQPTIRQMLRPFWFFGALMMMLDGVTTYIALTLHADKGAREGNPIAVWAIDHIGVAGMCTLKVLIGVTMIWRLAATADRGHRAQFLNRGLLGRKRPVWQVRRNAAWTLAFSLVLMGMVVGNNLRAIASLAAR